MEVKVQIKFSKKRMKNSYYKTVVVSPRGIKYFLELFKTNNWGKGILLDIDKAEDDQYIKSSPRRCHTCGGPSKGQYWCPKCRIKRMGGEISDRVDGDFIFA